MSFTSKSILFVLATALSFAPLAARAGGPIAQPPEDPPSGQPAEPPHPARGSRPKGIELFYKRDYPAARAELDKMIADDPKNDEARGLLARVLFFYGEYDGARAHLAKLGARSHEDDGLELVLDTPFKGDYKDAVAIMGGPSEKGHYWVATDYGFDQAKWNGMKDEYAAILARIQKDPKDAKMRKALDALLRESRTPGQIECARALEDIYEQYSSVIRFEKDARLCARVYVMKERADYLDYAGKICGKDMSDTGGVYVPTYRLLLVNGRDVGKQYGVLWQGTREVMFHEAFHQFIDYWCNPPSWANEGLAEFFKDTDEDPQTKKLILGTLKRLPNGSTGMTSFQETIGALKPTARFKPYSWPEFLRMPQSKFYASDEPDKQNHEAHMGANYAQGWSFCYFLVQGLPKGKGRTILFEYLKAFKDGKSNEEAIGIAFKEYKTDADWAKLDRQWREYMWGLQKDEPGKK